MSKSLVKLKEGDCLIHCCSVFLQKCQNNWIILYFSVPALIL